MPQPIVFGDKLPKYVPYLLLVPVLCIGLLPGPVLLGLWESLTYYHTFGAAEAPLSFAIAPRANIGGQGYALLEVSRAIIELLDLPLTLTTFRIPAIAFGMLTLAAFFVVAKRYFGAWPALGATALLATNQLFFQVQHMMSVLVISGAALMLLIERLQKLEIRYWDIKTWIGLSVVMVLIALHYGPARIFAVALLACWFLRAHWLLRISSGGHAVLKGIWVLAGYAFLALLALLAILDLRNLIAFLRLTTFLFPQHSDIAVLQYSAGEAGAVSFLDTIITNGKILAESMLGLTGDYHSQYSSYFLADFRYPLLGKMAVPFMLAGLLISLLRVRRRTLIFSTPWAYLLVIFAIVTLPLLFSLVTEKNGVLVSSLSDHRMYFGLIPLHLFVAASLAWAGDQFNASQSKTIFLGMLIVFMSTFQLVQLMKEHSRFERQVFSANPKDHGPGTIEYWRDPSKNSDRQSYSFYSHLQQHAQYGIAARQVARVLAGNDNASVSTNRRRAVSVNAAVFTEAPLVPSGLHYIANRNYHAIFMALYLGQEGLAADPVLVLSSDRKPISPELMGGLGYMGKPREYSAMLESINDAKLSYQRQSDANSQRIAVIHRIASRSVQDAIVTTTAEEEQVVKGGNYFVIQGLN